MSATTASTSIQRAHAIGVLVAAVLALAYVCAPLPLGVHNALNWILFLAGLIGLGHALWSAYRRHLRAGMACVFAAAWLLVLTFPIWIFALGFALGGLG